MAGRCHMRHLQLGCPLPSPQKSRAPSTLNKCHRSTPHCQAGSSSHQWRCYPACRCLRCPRQQGIRRCRHDRKNTPIRTNTRIDPVQWSCINNTGGLHGQPLRKIQKMVNSARPGEAGQGGRLTHIHLRLAVVVKLGQSRALGHAGEELKHVVWSEANKWVSAGVCGARLCRTLPFIFSACSALGGSALPTRFYLGPHKFCFFCFYWRKLKKNCAKRRRCGSRRAKHVE